MQRRHWSGLFVVLVMLVGLLPQAALAQSPNYYTSVIVSDVTSGGAVVGGTFTTDVSLSIVNNATPQLGVMGVDLYLGFNSAIASVDDADDNPANGTQVSVSTGFFGGSVVVAANEVLDPCPADGTMACVHLALSHTGSPITNRTGKVATVTWGGVAPGAMGLQVITPDTVLADADGNEVPINSTSVPAISVVDAGIIQGTVERQGQTTFADTDVVAYNTGGGVIGTAMTDASGYFTVTVPQGGIYLVQAMYNGYLKTQKSNVYVVGATVDLGTTTLMGGDVNGDNNINILDIVSIIGVYGSTGALTTDPKDINDDGNINIFDLTIAAGNFGKVGPRSW